MSSALRTGTYVLVALVALFELGVFWLMLHPDVSSDFRAYYIDKTTTCLNQPVVGTYALGEVIDFTAKGAGSLSRPNRVCGWEGPVGDGLHAVGTSSRLRFVYPGPEAPALLKLTLDAIRKDDQPTQRVEILFNGELISILTVTAGTRQDARIAVPQDLASAAGGRVELELRFPDAQQMGDNDPDNRRRSIKLLSAALLPA